MTGKKYTTKNGNTFFQEGDKIDFVSKSGNAYSVNIKTISCTCPDYKFRQAKIGGMCKHIQDVIITLTGQELDFKTFIHNDNDVMKFIDKFGDDKLEELKLRGEIIENKGKLVVLE